MELMQGKMLSGVNTDGEISSTWHRKVDERERHRSNGQREMKPERPTCHRARVQEGFDQNSSSGLTKE